VVIARRSPIEEGGWCLPEILIDGQHLPREVVPGRDGAPTERNPVRNEDALHKLIQKEIGRFIRQSVLQGQGYTTSTLCLPVICYQEGVSLSNSPCPLVNHSWEPVGYLGVYVEPGFNALIPRGDACSRAQEPMLLVLNDATRCTRSKRRSQVLPGGDASHRARRYPYR